MLLHPVPGSLVWPAAMVVWGPGFISASHRHHCVQLVMALQGALRVRRGPADEWKSCGAALIRPDAFHEVDARDGAVLKPPLSEAQVERWVKSQLLHRRRTVRIHPGVNRVLRYLRESLGVSEDFSLGKLAEISRLSRSRLMHVFTESVGVPIRPYVLWLRLQRAACDLMAGASVTAAAQNAGFSDAAHLTRTFRRMLGTTPSDLALRRRASRGVSMQSVEPVATQTFQPESYRPRWQPS